ncbi:MAG TPA: ATP-binding protein [Rhodocyclaceae bacterium]
MTSLRRTLLITLLGAIALISGLNALATYQLARAGIDELMDYQLRQLALSLRNQHLTRGFADPLVAPDEALDVVIQIWDVRGVRLYLSHPHTSLPSLVRLGYSTAATAEGSWRVYAVPMPDHVIQVAQRLRVRAKLAARSALQTLLPTLATIPVLGVLIWLLITRGLRPLQILTREVHHRQPEALAPIDSRSAPEEVRPLVDALNQLLSRLGRALDVQREFIADAAHELRTPLTALQIQLQLAESADDTAQRQNAHENLRGGLTRSIHLVNQLLTLARLEPGADDGKAAETHIALAALVRSALIDFAPLAAAREINLGATKLDEAAIVSGIDLDLRALLANLISNAVKYTPAGGQIDVAVDASGPPPGYARLRVDDSGPGIPEAERGRVFDRFYRRGAQGAPGASGTGLGLAIVQRIASRHRAEVNLGTAPLGGLRVEVRIPLAGNATDSPAPP